MKHFRTSRGPFAERPYVSVRRALAVARRLSITHKSGTE